MLTDFEFSNENEKLPSTLIAMDDSKQHFSAEFDSILSDFDSGEKFVKIGQEKTEKEEIEILQEPMPPQFQCDLCFKVFSKKLLLR